MTPLPLLRVIEAADLPPRRTPYLDASTWSDVVAIVQDVQTRGERGLREHAVRLDGLASNGRLFYSPRDLANARDRLPVDQRELLERTADRIRAFAAAQRACLTDLTLPISGGEAGHTCLPVESAGCYAPGGRFPLPSSVLMTAVTARTAGVGRVWVTSPRPTAVTLAAASIANADGLLAAGGAQAIAAMAYGAGPLLPSDMVVGPGNRWVTAAKQFISTSVGIDMLAGPSELVVLADAGANPALVAADLLAQAEHDEDAVPMLVTTSRSLPMATNIEIQRQLTGLPTSKIAVEALRNGAAVVCKDMSEAIAVCNTLAPEHLQIMATDAELIAGSIRHCGGLFIGSQSAETLGDYGAGPNHVLPTSRTARFRAGLSVFTFLRPRTWLRMSCQKQAMPIVQDATALARMEGLEGHARAADRRAVPNGHVCRQIGVRPLTKSEKQDTGGLPSFNTPKGGYGKTSSRVGSTCAPQPQNDQSQHSTGVRSGSL